jgi:phage head maturation protease
MKKDTRSLSAVDVREDGSGLVYYRGTTETVDSYGTILRTDGADLRRFMKNPTVLANHANDVLSVVGRAEVIERVSSPKSIDFGIRFAEGFGSHVADVTARLARAGFVRGASVSFMPTRVRSDFTDEERKSLGIGRWGAVIEEWELLELTLTAVPSNPDTLKRALDVGAITASDAEYLREIEAEEDDPVLAAIGEMTTTIVAEMQKMTSTITGAIVSMKNSAAIGRALDDANERIKRAAGGNPALAR